MSRSKSKSKHKPTKPQKPLKERKMALELVTPERMQHDPVEMVTAPGTDSNNRAQAGSGKAGRVPWTLERYHAHRKLAPRQPGRDDYDSALSARMLAVGIEYGNLRYSAGFVPAARAQQFEARVDGGGCMASGWTPAEHHQEHQRDLTAVDAEITRLARGSDKHVGVLAAVCAEGQPAAAWAHQHGYPDAGRTGLAFLRDALLLLLKVWGR